MALGEPWLHSQNWKCKFAVNFESRAVSGLASSLKLNQRLWPLWVNPAQSKVSTHRTTLSGVSSWVLGFLRQGFGRRDSRNTRVKTKSTRSHESQYLSGSFVWNHLGPFPSHSYTLDLYTILPKWYHIHRTNSNTRRLTCQTWELGICAGVSV